MQYRFFAGNASAVCLASGSLVRSVVRFLVLHKVPEESRIEWQLTPSVVPVVAEKVRGVPVAQGLGLGWVDLDMCVPPYRPAAFA